MQRMVVNAALGLCCRLYLSQAKSSQQHCKRPSVGSSRSDLPRRDSTATDNEHPGPIFLRHIVTRRFKYRWLTLAITSITCMSIIVIVSIVYSNT